MPNFEWKKSAVFFSRKLILLLGVVATPFFFSAEVSAQSNQDRRNSTNRNRGHRNRQPQGQTIGGIQCPENLFDQVQHRDTSAGWLGLFSGIKASEACKQRVRRDLKSHADLEAAINAVPELSLEPDRPNGWLSSCISRYESSQMPAIRRNRQGNVTNSSAREAARMSEEEKFAAAADYM